MWYLLGVLARRALALLVSPVALLLLPAAARGAEGERTLGFGLDYSTWTVPQDPTPDDRETNSLTAHGLALAADYEWGWNDTLWLRASAAGGYYSVPAGHGWSGGGTIGITYALDVLRYVPLVQAGIGALMIGGDGVETEIKPVVEIGLGLAVLESRTFSWGFVARFDSFASQVVFLTIGPRVTWRWGYF